MDEIDRLLAETVCRTPVKPLDVFLPISKPGTKRSVEVITAYEDHVTASSGKESGLFHNLPTGTIVGFIRFTTFIPLSYALPLQEYKNE